MANDEYAVDVEDAMGRLDVIPDYDPGDGPQPCVHTFAQAAFGLLGAHWSITQVHEFFERWGVQEAGPEATATGHGLVVVTDGPGARTIFFGTRPAD